MSHVDGGCDPLYLARRIVRIASEDIGMLIREHLRYHRMHGMLKSAYRLSRGPAKFGSSCYLAVAAKSNAVYKAFNQTMADVQTLPSYEVPMHLTQCTNKINERPGLWQRL